MSPARIATLVALPIALVAGLLVFWRLGGFDGGAAPAGPPRPGATTPVSMPAPSLDARRAELCRALLSRLPEKLRDAARRPVTAGAEQNAAYGDPPITLACGGQAPAVPPEAGVFLLDGVCWLSEERRDATVWTALARETPVAVTVPRAYQGPGQWVIEFSAPVAASVPAVGAPPPGCR